jgi:NAD(P)-dependent dehydrogenase (short-subunit alcohol dehydrogenase family)
MTIYAICGANRGIGLELSRQISERGDKVIALCRQASDELNQLDVEVLEGVDVGDRDSVNQAAKKLSGRAIDVLVHVSGILISDDLYSVDEDVVRQSFEINTLGPLRVIYELLPNMHDHSKIFILSSRVGSLADNSSGSNYAYRMSKTAVNMLGVNLSVDLKSKGISVILLHPGYVKTDMTQGSGLVEADESAAGLIARMDELGLEHTGTFWHMDGSQLPW